jgi:hypothetical protein
VVYPIFQREWHDHSKGFVAATYQSLGTEGYPTSPLPAGGYATHAELAAVDRIVRPVRVTFRRTAISAGRIAMDGHALVEVWAPDDIENRRLFEVWARNISPAAEPTSFGPLYQKLADNLLSIDKFREALALARTP